MHVSLKTNDFCFVFSFTMKTKVCDRTLEIEDSLAYYNID